MPEQTNEAPAPEVVTVYPDEETQALAEALDAKIAAEAEVEKATTQTDDVPLEGAQAEEVSASVEGSDVEPEGKPEAAPEVEADEPPIDLKGLPDEWKDRLLKAHKAGALGEEELAETKTLVLKGMGFDKKAREFAEARKELEQKAALGEQLSPLFSDDAEMEQYLSWRSQRGEEETEEAPPSFDTDEDLIKYSKEQAERAAERRFNELLAEQKRVEQASHDQTLALTRAAHETFESVYGVADDVAEDDPRVSEYNAACELLNAEIRADGQLPWDVLTDADVFSRKIQPHLERVQLKARLASLEQKLNVRANEQSKSDAARSAGVSSPEGRSTRTEADYPDTPEGRAARTLAKLEGRLPPDF